MASTAPQHTIIVGAGAAGLMAGTELSAAGHKITLLEARDRCGGRIWALPAQDFGYPAEGGAEFIHGAAPVTKKLVRAAGLTLRRSGAGERWDARGGRLFQGTPFVPSEDRLYDALASLTRDLTLSEFLAAHFGSPADAELRTAIIRMTEGYDAADPDRASVFALRDEWLGGGDREGARIVEGYGALIDFLETRCREQGATIRFGAVVKSLTLQGGKAVLQCQDGARHEADRVILSVPLPILGEIAFTPAVPAKLAAAGDIGFGDVVKILLNFETPWWADLHGQDLRHLSFLLTDQPVPTWWAQYPEPYPVLTGWLAGPRAATMFGRSEAELVDLGVTSLADSLAIPADRLRRGLRAARAFHWGADPFARGAYSYATPESKAAQAELLRPVADILFFSGEALYGGKDMGTVEAALASGQNTAQEILATGVR